MSIFHIVKNSKSLNRTLRKNVFKTNILFQNEHIISRPCENRLSLKTCPIIKRYKQFKEFKKLLVKYWYIVIPVHVLNDIIFFFAIFCFAKKCACIYIFLNKFLSCFFLSSRRVDETLLELNESKQHVKALRESWLGSVAVTIAFMKLLSPIRIGITLALTTICIKMLKNVGYLAKLDEKKAKFVEKQIQCTARKKHR